MAKKKKEQSVVVELKPLDIRTLHVKVIGDTPLITHAWSEKARKMMLDKQMGKARGPKERKDPKKDYEASKHGGGPSREVGRWDDDDRHPHRVPHSRR